MDTLDGTEWDVLIVGTGLPQSLLALALSRSGKKILHIDENGYYGGTEAAFSLQEAEEWEKHIDEDVSAAAFSNISITKSESAVSETTPSLSFSRAYSLALSPQLIYARSTLLQYLVSSKVYRQLEFLAVGSWWVYSAESDNMDNGEPSISSESGPRHGRLLKVPNGREDVFQDQVLDFKAKRALMRFLRFITEYEEQMEMWEDHRTKAFPTFLSEQFKIPITLHAPLLALTLSPSVSSQTTTEYALPRIARHLRSIGLFGAGFGSVIPKWGGMSEITQVACRASAVGGGVYVLGKRLSCIDGPTSADNSEEETSGFRLRLNDGEAISAQHVVGELSRPPISSATCCKSITIVSSPLPPLFPPIAEDAPPPACAVVVFPSGSLPLDADEQAAELPPIYIFIHNSDAGECAAGQSVLYASTTLTGEKGFQLLKKAVRALLLSVDVTPAPNVLWTLQYEQHPRPLISLLALDPDERPLDLLTDLAFDDSVLDHVKGIWQQIMGDSAGDFLVFEDREANQGDDDE
ncbi:rab geranylgeranyl transferase escort protein-like protein [Lindgomyces ingoldianus]|uniref:Rab geranylgeranyl transferase escort protein-like protein n=1 Tax=Lindgomyces ingoldianus TaxID=673940 RepID=A0ACB6QG33_9PLEO|nr:rab geranylgeranyl transferase escort protein-like protein [Lindgomyces ingoldianus]KAF2465886.1 rab geranylgeranyl transferase escort protein-like protein [Lindgomyces ingoldianus]